MKGNLNTIFGEILRDLRTRKGFTQQQLADYSGLDRAYISELENGKLQPSLETFLRLSYELKVKPKDFIEEVEISKNSSKRIITFENENWLFNYYT